jgi:branched-subunit amino acid aminotransferase/4-amino-4-deoxychorismate lyase
MKEFSMGMHAILNGKVIKAEEATLSVQDRELQYGFGVYESLRVIEGKAVYPEDHIERLFHSATGIALRHQFTSDQVLTWLRLLIASDNLEEATIRILLMGGMEARLFITSGVLLTYPEAFYTEGITCISYEGERLFPQYKTCSLLMNYVALRQASTAGAFEALLVDRNDRVLEGTRSNVFACTGNTLYTAPSHEVLEGVTRDRILKAAEQLGYSIVYEAPTRSDLLDLRYDELFISSTSMGALPVASFDGKPLAQIGTMAHPIHALIRQWEMNALH